MQRAIIDCRTGKVSYIELSPTEESQHLEEIERNKLKVRELEQAEVKRRLVQELTELREMKLNPDLFTADDITEKQVEVDRLTEKIEIKDSE